MRGRVLFAVLCSAAAVVAVPVTATAATAPVTGTITTVAGNGATGGAPGDGGPATAAEVDTPSGVAYDAAGNAYVCEYWSSRVRKISPQGVITTFAGTGTYGSGPDGGQAAVTQLKTPSGIAVDKSGNVFIADDLDSKIREVTPSGVVTTVAGTGSYGFGGDGGPAGAATLNGPNGLAVDSAGDLYVADTNNNRVRKIDTHGVITTVLGNGAAGSGTGQLGHPHGVAVDGNGTLFVADTDNNRVEALFASGGNPLEVDGGYSAPDLRQLNHPRGVAVDPSGNLYVADTGNNRISLLTPWYQGLPVAGTASAGFTGDGGQATAAELNAPQAVAVDGAADVLVADTSNDRVRLVSEGPAVTAVVGDRTRGNGGDGGPAVRAQLDNPVDITVDGVGDLFIADSGNWEVRKVSPDGVITTFLGPPSFYGTPALVADKAGNLYMAGYSQVLKVDPHGTVSVIAGKYNSPGFAGDGGPATQAQLSAVAGLALDGAGNLYIQDESNSRIRKIDTNGVITTVAGNGTKGFSGDGGPATAASIAPQRQSGIAVDQAGNLYFLDSDHYVIRKVSVGGTITTVAGNGSYWFGNPVQYVPDNVLGTSISLAPSTGGGLAVDGSGVLYFSNGNTIEKVGADGILHFVAGLGENLKAGSLPGTCAATGASGGAARFTEFGSDGELAFDAAGSLYVTDPPCGQIYRIAQR